jgi:hypothetical protein
MRSSGVGRADAGGEGGRGTVDARGGKTGLAARTGEADEAGGRGYVVDRAGTGSTGGDGGAGSIAADGKRPAVFVAVVAVAAGSTGTGAATIACGAAAVVRNIEDPQTDAPTTAKTMAAQLTASNDRARLRRAAVGTVGAVRVEGLAGWVAAGAPRTSVDRSVKASRRRSSSVRGGTGGGLAGLLYATKSPPFELGRSSGVGAGGRGGRSRLRRIRAVFASRPSGTVAPPESTRGAVAAPLPVMGSVSWLGSRFMGSNAQ